MARTNHINTKVAAERAMLDHIERVLYPERVPTRKEMPTFSEWFKGRFWKEWVIGRKNKPTEVRSKNIIYESHLKPRFGDMPLDEITTSEVAQFRADLVATGAQREAHQQHPRGAVEAAEVRGRLRADHEGAEDRDVQGRAAGDRRVGLRAVRSSPRGGEGRRRGLVRRGVSVPARRGFASARSRRCVGVRTST